jgi:hypothetical protein
VRQRLCDQGLGLHQREVRPLLCPLVAALLLAFTNFATGEDASRGVAFGATCDSIKQQEARLASTFRGELEDRFRERFKGQRFLVFDGKSFGKDARVTYNCNHPEWDQTVTIRPVNEGDLESYAKAVAASMEALYGKPVYSPEDFGLIKRALTWLFNRNQFIAYAHTYIWRLTDRNIRVGPTSYPGLLPNRDMPWEIAYWTVPPCSSRGCQADALNNIEEMFRITIEDRSPRNTDR